MCDVHSRAARCCAHWCAAAWMGWDAASPRLSSARTAAAVAAAAITAESPPQPPILPLSTTPPSAVCAQDRDAQLLPSPHAVDTHTPSTVLDVAFSPTQDARVVRDLPGCAVLPPPISHRATSIEMPHCASPVDDSTAVSACTHTLHALLHPHSHRCCHRECAMREMASIGGVGCSLGTVMVPSSLV